MLVAGGAWSVGWNSFLFFSASTWRAMSSPIGMAAPGPEAGVWEGVVPEIPG